MNPAEYDPGCIGLVFFTDHLLFDIVETTIHTFTVLYIAAVIGVTLA